MFRRLRGRVAPSSAGAGQGRGAGLRGEPGLAAACLDARGAAAASHGRGEEPQDRGWAPRGSGMGTRRIRDAHPEDRGWAPGGSGLGTRRIRDAEAAGSSISPAALRPWGLPERKAGDPWSSPTLPGCRHALPSLFLSPKHTRPSPGAAGHRMEGWESPRLLASTPPHGGCSRVSFSAPAFVEAKYSYILAAR